MYYNRFRRGQSGTRRIRSFDPSSVINAHQRYEKTPECAITHEFNDFAIDEQLKRNIIGKGYKIPTPIQDQAIIPLLEGRDLIGIANTGTGKTAAFLIPLIDKVVKNPREQVLIITPTRELAAQIRDEFVSFSRNLRIYCALCIGGAALARQVRDLRYNPNFVIGTPGRIQDLLRSRYLNLSNFRSIVLDEADRMVDIGFMADIKYIISLLPKSRQSLFFSATIDGKVREVLNSFVQNPITISVKTGDTAENIQQEVVRVVDREKKIEQLHSLLIQKEFEKVLLFGRTKHGVQKLSDELVRRGFRADAIHGNKKQNQRTRTLEKFKNNQIQILLATDVASRGLDIPNVSHVINYDLPESYDAYIHRIGRTGRADKKGVALTFVS
ncbi:MAG: DEAD/DEAH box helicase [Candidatus Woesebacteria bacterium]|nr:DEAD/DEAH box helicase [Candidatus Woesebacteria bacterium]